MKRIILSGLLLAAMTTTEMADDPETRRQYLSGRGCDDMVQCGF